MKKTFLTLFLLFSLVGVCFAEVYVIVNPTTNEVISAIDKDIAVVETGYEKKILPGNLSDYGLTLHPTYYKLKNNKFIQDNEKISAEENSKTEAKEYLEEKKLVDKKLQDMAIDALKEDGITLKHIKK